RAPAELPAGFEVLHLAVHDRRESREERDPATGAAAELVQPRCPAGNAAGQRASAGGPEGGPGNGPAARSAGGAGGAGNRRGAREISNGSRATGYREHGL